MCKGKKKSYINGKKKKTDLDKREDFIDKTPTLLRFAGAAMAQLIRPIRQLSPQCNHHFRSLRHLFSKKLQNPPSSIPNVLLFSSFTTARSPPRRRVRPAPPEALTPTVIAEDDGDSDGSESDSLKSRNQRKRDARRATRWGMELASFSSDQVKRILR